MSSPHCLVTWPGCMWPGHQGRTGPELSWLAAESECLGKPIGPPLWVLTHSASKRRLPASAALVRGGVGETRTGSALSSLQRCFLSGPQLHSRAGPESFSPNGLHRTETTLKVQLM